MEKLPRFVVKLSLEEMALRKSIINVWSETDVLCTIGDLEFESLPEDPLPNDCEEALYDMVKEKVSNLAIPEPLKKRMTDIVKLIGVELIRWKISHESIFTQQDGASADILKQLCWTHAGTVDYQKTAEKLLRLEALRAETRYRLAALHCLVRHIPKLWTKLSKTCKQNFLTELPFLIARVKLDVSWAYLLTGKESTLDILASYQSPGDSFQELACKYAALSGNKGAVDFFIKRLPKEIQKNFIAHLVDFVVLEREGYALRRVGDFPVEKLSEVVCYLLLQMSPEQQMKVLKNQPYEFFTCFLDWPLQDFCLEMVNLICKYLPEEDYFFFMQTISQNIENSDHYFPEFLQKLFSIAPNIFKSSFVAYEPFHRCLFPKFFDAEDTSTIKAIFRNLDESQRFTLVYHCKFFLLLDSLVMTDKQYLVNLCLEEALESEQKKCILKENYMRFLAEFHTSDLGLRKRIWRQVFRDTGKALVVARSKRVRSENIVTEVKRLCSRKK